MGVLGEVEFELESRQSARERIFHMITVPRLRVIGLSLLILLATINQFWIDPQPVAGVMPLAVALLTYAFGSWWALRRWFAVLQGKWDLGLCFLVVDVPVWSAVVYVCGADRCWFSYVLLARVADQIATRFGRVLFFAHWIPLNYLGMVACAGAIGHHLIDWPGELFKALVMYVFGLYSSLTARTAARLRARTVQAVRTARRAMRELTEARESAETASRVKGQFLTMMDHELKTPLNGIMGFSELLMQTSQENLTPKQVRYLRNVHASGLRLGNLVSGILDLAQLKGGDLKLQLKPIDASLPLARALHTLDDNIQSRSLTVDSTVGDLPLCQADPGRLQQVFFQLLDNAVKFSHADGKLVLRAEHHEKWLLISIRDSGPGIPLERQQRIFDEWGKVDFTYRRLQEGAGIGLALAQQLIELHGGRLSVESAPGQGACFTIHLPIF